MKHIAFLYDHILDVGGVENHILSLVRCFKNEDLRFSMISRTSPAFHSRAQALGARIISQPPRKPLSPAWIFDLTRKIREEGIDLLHIHGPIAATSGRIAAILTSTLVVVTFHLPASRYHGTSQTMRARLGRYLYTTVDRGLNHLLPGPLLYVSQTYREEEIRAGRVPALKSIFIPNGIDLAAYSNLPQPRPDLPLVVLFAGRLSDEKGCDILIRALSMLPPGLPAFECHIAGQGPLRSKLESLANEITKPGQPVIRFLGHRSDLPRIMASADIFVLPSRFESVGLALIEAMASGLPSIVTAVGDGPLIVADRSSAGIEPAGFVVPPGDPAALADKISQLLSNEPLRRSMSATARRNAQAYDERETARQVLAVYRRLLD